MRLLFVVCILFVLDVGTLCQNATPEPHIAAPEELISNAIKYSAFEGNMQKQISQMGDAAGVSVTRVLGSKDMSANDIEIILVILRSAFADPSGVRAAADREPRTTLFVLHSLDRYVNEPGLKKRISDAEIYVNEQFMKYRATRPTT